MITIQTTSGEIFDLTLDSKLSISDNNPFFSDDGTYSLSLDLPFTTNNARILGFPHLLENRAKINTSIDVVVRSGMYSKHARMSILNVKKNSVISVTLYLRESIFFNKIKNVGLLEIFKNKSIQFSTIDATISFVRSLITGYDTRFACFQVLTDNYILNEATAGVQADGYYGFVRAVETTDTVDDKQILVPKGFYITPFIKVKHLLTEVLSYFGYSLAPSFLDNAPFCDMCFLNNNLDTIVDNSINYVDIVPDISVTELLDVLRKFNLEYVVDEQKKIVSLVLFDDILDSASQMELTSSLIDNPSTDYSQEYKQLKLTSNHVAVPEKMTLHSERTISPNYYPYSPVEKNLSIKSLKNLYPNSHLDDFGIISRDCVTGEMLLPQVLGFLSNDYFADDQIAVEEKTFDDYIPGIFILYRYPGTYSTFISVGKERALRSQIVYSDGSDSQESDLSSLVPMLCFCFKTSTFVYGTIHNTDLSGNKLWNYTLEFYGDDGIFERFWRRRDTLLRNALLRVECDLLLDESQKLNISPLHQVSIQNQNYFVEELKYVFGEKTIETCSLLSLKLQEPISRAKTTSEYFPPRVYKWNIRYERSHNYEWKYKSEPIPFYPADPTAAQYAVGGRYYQRTYAVEYGKTGRDGDWTKITDGTITVWLEPALA
jgi:hypothetical protein